MKNLKALIMLTVLCFSSACPAQKSQNTEIQNSTEKRGYQIGDAATDFRLKNIDGNMVSLSDFSDAKGFIVIFTCNHCPYAKKYEERIIELDKKFKEMGYPVVAINPNDPKVQPEDSYQKMIERAREKGFTFPYLVDEKQEIFPQYGATKTPHVFVLQKYGERNIVKYIGAIDNNYENPADVSERYVQDAVNALVNGQEIKTAKTVAIGCSIKVKK
ncbi:MULTISPECIES: thioredoxin family protein [Chryseobacterium]|uniref:Thiol-disulfide oxidoreductase n=1 Tax=Chryseobacterium taihuense TaxID=1141221 RepID=A0A4U8WH12_9FLAO|nr:MULTISPECIES: thioredoxin family protein [Chryseobacterium]QQV02394.1 thioredoxin family protein [Chryseobacterium sp. FDAARGOS 1104]VFB04355.1 thiol-disulfide oxidoreductase [Chryseobacterium taihuense]